MKSRNVIRNAKVLPLTQRNEFESQNLAGIYMTAAKGQR